ncbi:MAG TPA: RNA-binding S4 domain-containing protein [Allosphingosinicella sp.]|nr:RNA-binding S4 domain-containing protein [Allosphingosinicella sp.]
MADSLRLDKFLWFARIVKTRALAQALAEQGRIRIGGRIVDRAHAPVRVGDVLSFAQRGAVRVLRVEALPARRGPPAEARALYSEVPEGPLTSEGSGD